MHSYLRQSTNSQSRAIGPFLDDGDFKTAETGLTIANTDIKLVVNGGASANKNSGGGTHRVNGIYGVTFDSTDTATVGEMLVSVVVAGALPVFTTFVVLEEAVYDQLFAASAPGAATPTEVAAIKAITDAIGSTAAGRLALSLGASPAGTVDTAGFTPTTTAFEASSITEATADHYNGRVILFTSGAMLGQAAQITDYALVGGRGHFTVSNMTEAPANGVTFLII